MSIQSNINSIIGSVGTAAYLIKDLKFKKDIKDVSNQISQNIEKDPDTGSNNIFFKPTGTRNTWKRGNSPVDGGGVIIQPGENQTAETQEVLKNLSSKYQTAETQAALKSLKKRQTQLYNFETGKWDKQEDMP